MKQLPQPAPQHDCDSSTGSGDSSTKSKSNPGPDDRDPGRKTADSDDLLEVDNSCTVLLLRRRLRGGESVFSICRAGEPCCADSASPRKLGLPTPGTGRSLRSGRRQGRLRGRRPMPPQRPMIVPHHSPIEPLPSRGDSMPASSADSRFIGERRPTRPGGRMYACSIPLEARSRARLGLSFRNGCFQGRPPVPFGTRLPAHYGTAPMSRLLPPPFPACAGDGRVRPGVDLEFGKARCGAAKIAAVGRWQPDGVANQSRRESLAGARQRAYAAP